MLKCIPASHDKFICLGETDRYVDMGTKVPMLRSIPSLDGAAPDDDRNRKGWVITRENGLWAQQNGLLLGAAKWIVGAAKWIMYGIWICWVGIMEENYRMG